MQAPVTEGFDDWHGADVVVATGWDTVYPALLLAGCRARAYLVQDHEPEFFPDLGAAPVGGADLLARPLRDLREPLAARPAGAPVRTARQLVPAGRGPRHLPPRPERAPTRHRDLLRPRDTPRRAVPLGRARARGAAPPPPGPASSSSGRPRISRSRFAYEQLGCRRPGTGLDYAEATVGLCLSLTNYSLIPQEMMACGLPCVDVPGLARRPRSAPDAGIEVVAAPDPVALADAMERLLDRSRALGAGAPRPGSVMSRRPRGTWPPSR